MSVGVIGGGSWGVALAQLAAESGPVALWARRAGTVAEIMGGQSSRLPGVALSPEIRASDDSAILRGADLILCVVPVQATRAVLADLAPHLHPAAPVVLCSKGLERGTLALPTEIAAEVLSNPLAVLSGPSFAADVVRGLPTAVTVASGVPGLATDLQTRLGTPSFRPYASDDPVGAQVGGAIKNVLAIACGIVAGRGLGESARAALVARGLAEMTRLGLAMGAQRDTLAGLSGMGDLVLTCGSEKSRNFTAGLMLGDPARETGARGISEGTHTAGAAVALAARHGVEMPICETVAAILEGALSVDEGIERLLSRPLGKET